MARRLAGWAETLMLAALNKPHPDQASRGRLSPAASGGWVWRRPASIHDLLAAASCALAVTRAGGEAFVRRKPVVPGGR